MLLLLTLLAAEEMETTVVVGEQKSASSLTGAANFLDAEQLEALEYDDVHRILLQIPGVYVRGEDGFGLRPNIGLRGASSDRSGKVTLMVDDVLLAPAPYSAPAAYYFPITTRMVGVDIFKGPSAITHGPHTIGGAINFVTRDIPEGWEGGIDLAAGQYVSGKAHGYVGYGTKRWGVLAEGVHLQSDGFKNLIDNGNTGFDKNELMLKGHVILGERVKHVLGAKLGLADETSYETYLGLTDTDFAATPLKRYAASQLGRMTWERNLIELTYRLGVGTHTQFTLTAYRHNLVRRWRKLNRFRGGPALQGLLLDPENGQNASFISVLRGDSDTQGFDDTLLIGTNLRRFRSEGVQWRMSQQFQFGPVDAQLSSGVRYHHDWIKRRHTEDGYLMQRKTLVRDGLATDTITLNTAETHAVASYAQLSLSAWDVTVAPGMRYEWIRGGFLDRLPSSTQAEAQFDNQSVWMPGIGAAYQVLPELSVLAGVYRGFSPVAPGQVSQIESERSLNYEVGARVDTARFQGEVLGFANDYSNLLGTCTISSGCTDTQLAQQFNGGAVFVYGLESQASTQHQLPWGIDLGARITYTLTLSEFQSSFTSANPQFGNVTAGDALSYVPVHQASVNVTLGKGIVRGEIALSYVGEMRDVPGQDDIPDLERIPAHAVLDVLAACDTSDDGTVYLKIDNLFDQRYIVSRRPFGARPGKPFQVLLGYKHSFGGHS